MPIIRTSGDRTFTLSVPSGSDRLARALTVSIVLQGPSTDVKPYDEAEISERIR